MHVYSIHFIATLHVAVHVYVLCVVGVSVTTSGPNHSNPSTDLLSANQLADYAYITTPFETDRHGVLLRCATGVGPTSGYNNNVLGAWYFGRYQIPEALCSFRQYGFHTFTSVYYPGIINLYLCGPLSPDEEGVYSCMMMNSSMMNQTTRVGLYLSGRSESLDMHNHLIVNHL